METILQIAMILDGNRGRRRRHIRATCHVSVVPVASQESEETGIESRIGKGARSLRDLTVVIVLVCMDCFGWYKTQLSICYLMDRHQVMRGPIFYVLFYRLLSCVVYKQGFWSATLCAQI